MPIEKNIKLLSWLNFCTDFVFFAPVSILYFAHVTGSYALGMSIFSIAYVSSAVFEVPTGIVSDMVGRKKTTILGAASSVLCVTLYAIGGSYWMLMAGALVQGLSRAFYSGNNDALLHDTLREIGKTDEYHVYLGRTSSMFQIAMAIAAVSGSIIASRSFVLVMWASVIPQIGALLISMQLVEPKRISRKSSNIFSHLRESVVQFRINNKLRLLTMASIIGFSLGESSFFLRSVFINSLWPLWAVGLSYFLSHAGASLSLFNSGKIINKFGSLKLLDIEIIFNRIVNFIALLFPSVVSPVLMGSTSVSSGVSWVAMNTLLQHEFTHAQRATMSSLNAVGGSIAFGVFSVVLGAIADRFDARIAMILANILLLTPLFLYRKIFLYERVKLRDV